jgi:hypothetical protein
LQELLYQSEVAIAINARYKARQRVSQYSASFYNRFSSRAGSMSAFSVALSGKSQKSVLTGDAQQNQNATTYNIHSSHIISEESEFDIPATQKEKHHFFPRPFESLKNSSTKSTGLKGSGISLGARSMERRPSASLAGVLNNGGGGLLLPQNIMGSSVSLTSKENTAGSQNPSAPSNIINQLRCSTASMSSQKKQNLNASGSSANGISAAVIEKPPALGKDGKSRSVEILASVAEGGIHETTTPSEEHEQQQMQSIDNSSSNGEKRSSTGPSLSPYPMSPPLQHQQLRLHPNHLIHNNIHNLLTSSSCTTTTTATQQSSYSPTASPSTGGTEINGSIPPIETNNNNILNPSSIADSVVDLHRKKSLSSQTPRPRPSSCVPPDSLPVPSELLYKYNAFYNLYIRSGAINEVNVSADVRESLRRRYMLGKWMIDDFNAAKEEVVMNMVRRQSWSFKLCFMKIDDSFDSF